MSRRSAQPTHRSSRTRGKRSLLSRVRKARRWLRPVARRGQPGDLFQLEEEIRGVLLSDRRRPRELEDENGRLKSIIVGQIVDRETLQGVIKRSRRRRSEAEQRSEAGSQARDHRRGSGELAGDDPQSMSGFALRSFDLPLPVLSQRSDLSDEAYQGICETHVRHGYRRVHDIAGAGRVPNMEKPIRLSEGDRGGKLDRCNQPAGPEQGGGLYPRAVPDWIAAQERGLL